MISKFADIHPDAIIGNNVTIDSFAVIQKGVSVGDNSHIMSHAVIMEASNIGKGCKIYPGAIIGGSPQDLKFNEENTTAEIGDNTTIRECVTINRGTTDKWKTVIGKNCLLMAYTHVAHDCIIGNNVVLANSVQLAGHVEVGDYAILGGLCAAVQFIHIGAHTYIAGQSGIGKDVPPFIKAARDPLSYAGVNSVGLQRRGFSLLKINNILDMYRYIFGKGMNISQALEFIEESFPPSDEKNEIINFVRHSGKGIIKIQNSPSDED